MIVMLDLLFIIFDSANLSLAFDTLFDVRWSCRSVASSADFKDGLDVRLSSPSSEMFNRSIY